MTYQAEPFYKNKAISALSIAGMAVTLGLAGCSNNDTAETTANADGTPSENIELLNVSYDVARDFYKDYNPMFVEHYQAETLTLLSISSSRTVAQVSKHCLWLVVYKPTWQP